MAEFVVEAYNLLTLRICAVLPGWKSNILICYLNWLNQKKLLHHCFELLIVNDHIWVKLF
jgi:hypothetical protein